MISYPVFKDEGFEWEPRHLQLWYDNVIAGGKLDEFMNPHKVKAYYYYYDPLLGYRLTPNFKKEGITITSNGFRGLKDVLYRRMPGKKRVVVLGDSMTMGAHVLDDETYCHRLESRLDDTEVVNLAVAGYGIDQQYLSLCLDGYRFRPDVVVMGLFTGDIERAELSFRTYGKPKFELNGNNLKLTNVPVPLPAHYLEEIKKISWFRRRTITDRILFRYYRIAKMINTNLKFWSGSTLTLAARILDATKVFSETIGAQFILLIIPDGNMLNDTSLGRDVLLDFLSGWAKYTNTECVDLWELFRGMPPNLREKLNLRDGKYWHHLSPYGHRKTAEVLSCAIVKTFERQRK